MAPARGRSLLALMAMLLTGAVPALAGGGAGEISLFGSTMSGEFGAGVPADVQSMTFRYVRGDVLRFRIDVPLLRMRGSLGIALTGAGTTPIGERGEMWRQGGGQGPGGDPQGALVAPGLAGATVPEEERWISGMGDLRLAVSRRLAGGGVKLHRVDVEGELKLPTADERDGLGTGATDLRLGLAGEYRFWTATAFAGAGWNRLGDPGWGPLDDVFDAYAGLESEPLVGGRLVASAWLEAFGEAVPGAGGRVSFGAGLRGTGRMRWLLQARTGVSGSSEDLMLVTGVSIGLRPSGAALRGTMR